MSEDKNNGCGCLLVCLGIGILVFCGLHGCAAVITALRS
jgi:hypothetical protein